MTLYRRRDAVNAIQVPAPEDHEGLGKLVVFIAEHGLLAPFESAVGEVAVSVKVPRKAAVLAKTGQWIVVHRPGRVDVLDGDAFDDLFEEVKPPPSGAGF